MQRGRTLSSGAAVLSRRRRRHRAIFSMAWLFVAALAHGQGALQPADVASAYNREVSPRLALPDAERVRYGELANHALVSAGLSLLAPQYVVIADRNIYVQAVFVYWLHPVAPPLYIGASPASTGQVGTFDHFETPTGVFPHTLGNPDYRAEGIKNANGILGYGVKGMRVYDFGWQDARQGWGAERIATMRLQMHATDPYLLEAKLGTPQSKGCIRIPATLNEFIDRLGLLDAEYELAADLGIQPWVLRAQRTPTYGAGRYLIVVDTERRTRPDWSPRRLINLKNSPGRSN
ncbi:L,D-transpeptidase [Achromobacter sp. JUb104]|uniref:L,D-transpeptidase n=1 Tax=Achromobacter sp. JUb104 TaxID=2940590 RepID=UPI0021687C39|nr:L,D-transpeptidase [Achromobacter sp. JUb104]MCS3504313.1 hypothetical protein [Achromobacter sp. JUb104]